MKNIGIITGATGYIGSHLCKYLLKKGWEIHIIAQPEFGYDNIKNFKEQIHIFEYKHDINALIEYFKKVNADAVFHLAAAVITNYNPNQISTLIQSNIQFGAEILEAMKASNTKLFIGTGSYWQNYNNEDYNPVDFYAATKEAFEKILKYYTEVENIHAITLRLFDVYGTNDMRPKLWNIIKQKARKKESIELSPGEQLLDMVYISDVSCAYEQAYNLLKMNREIKNKVYGVYTNRRKPLKEIVEIYTKMLNNTIYVNYGSKSYKKREVMCPTTRLEILTGWEPKISLEEGLRKLTLEE